MKATIILNDMDRTNLASFGFRSWLLQNIQEPFEIILNLFNNKAKYFEELCIGANPQCNVIIKTYKPPKIFNISAANNLGLYYAKGEYVLFANSDIIYPGFFLETFINELRKRSISYATASRVQLNEQQTRELQTVEKYSINNNFYFLRGFEHYPGRLVQCSLSPWTVNREIALKIGGFDPKVLCHEDSEFNDRIMHYLRRTKLQDGLFSITDLYGYHLNHPTSDLYHLSQQSKSILEPRRLRLMADPNSMEDIAVSNFNSLDSLLDDLYSTNSMEIQNEIPNKYQPHVILRIINRIKRAIRILIRGS